MPRHSRLYEPNMKKMSSKKNRPDTDVALMQRRIDEGILLAQRRLLNKVVHDNLSFIVCHDGIVTKVPAREIQWK